MSVNVDNDALEEKGLKRKHKHRLGYVGSVRRSRKVGANAMSVKEPGLDLGLHPVHALAAGFQVGRYALGRDDLR